MVGKVSGQWIRREHESMNLHNHVKERNLKAKEPHRVASFLAVSSIESMTPALDGHK